MSILTERRRLARQIRQIREDEVSPILKLVTQIIRRNIPTESCRILLFGSWATLEAEPRSDIDIAILGEVPVDDRTMARIRHEVDHLPTLRTVQVVDLAQMDERFRRKVLAQSEVLS